MNKRLLISVVLLVSGVLAQAEEVDMSDWKDPIDRDETIKHTTVSVTVK